MRLKKDETKKNLRKIPSEKEVPGWFSRMWFCWMFPIFYKGTKRDLEEYDLVPPKGMYNSARLGEKLYKNWLKEEAIARASGTKPSFIKVLIGTFGWSFMFGGILQFITLVLKLLSPFLFAGLLRFWSVDSTMDRATAVYYGVGMILCTWISAFTNQHGNLYCQQFAMKIRIATSSLLFRKVLRMSNCTLSEMTAGKVVNILSNDLDRFDHTCLFLHYVWILPVQLAIVLYLGYIQAGCAAFIGFAALIFLSFPLQGIFGHFTGVFRGRMAEATDKRIKLMNEVVNGIHVVKMYAWEVPFQKMVNEKRKEELRWLKLSNTIRALMCGFLVFMDKTVIFFIIVAYVLFGNPISASVIFPLQQFINIVSLHVTVILPMVISYVSEVKVTLRRVQEFLEMEDRADLLTKWVPTNSTLFGKVSNGDAAGMFDDKKSVRTISYQLNSETKFLNGTPTNSFSQRKYRTLLHPKGLAVDLQDVSASWKNDLNVLTLKNITLCIRKEQLCAVIGAVGSGKSSLLHLLLKELPAITGSVMLDGRVSYASQEPWLFPATVRENILFGLTYDHEKYKQVIKNCALEKDFKQFPFADQSLVGERGITLSGGQRARINLARAVYREADIYLLDDPLSAVDANVGRQLFEDCIKGYMDGRTRILVTHQIHFLKAADYIIVLNDGSVEIMGTFDELMSRGKEYSTMITALQEGKDKDTGSFNSGETANSVSLKIPLQNSPTEQEETKEFEAQKMVAEERSSGNLKWEVVASYFRSGGSWCFVIYTFSFTFITIACGAVVDYWISFWTNQVAVYEASLNGTKPDPGLDVQVGLFTTGQYLLIYGCLILVFLVLAHIRIIPYVRMVVNASQNLHNNMFASVLWGTLRFFDTNTSGRILNRFTKDTGGLDDVLPRSLLFVIQTYFSLCSTLVLNAISLYITLIPSIILAILFVLFVKFYLKVAQSIKRLEGVAKSPVFGMVASSLSGVATIRCNEAQAKLIKEFDFHQDLHSTVWNGFLCGAGTFAFYMDTVCAIYLAVVVFVYLFLDFSTIAEIGSIGLVLTQTSFLIYMLQTCARLLVDFLSQLTSVERVIEYTNIEKEQNLFEGQISMPPTWPSQGRIVFQNVSLRYAPNDAPVLKNLDIIVESGWKVGIVGRTGAGKSSLLSALFRFAYIDGNILIDGIDTSLVSKQGLRSKISIIPQEPVLFSATLRYNLDPLEIYSDEDMWRALEQVDMKSAVPSLDFKVTEGGTNFSVGQRQLICLARAILRSNKILVMDEATANVDLSTDKFIQQTIRRKFADCTVLSIAHRLNTIMDSDRVLVMSFGKVTEFDHPYILLSDPNSTLSSMVRETGEKNSAALFQVAKKAYFSSDLKEHGHELEDKKVN